MFNLKIIKFKEMLNYFGKNKQYFIDVILILVYNIIVARERQESRRHENGRRDDKRRIQDDHRDGDPDPRKE